MNVLSKLVSAFLLILFSAASQAQNYYVCDTGDDANDGKSEAKPFKTHAKAIETFNKMLAGDSVLFCRGGIFYADQQLRLSNSKCGADKVCSIADYGSEKLPRPIIQAVKQAPFNFQNGGDSKPDGGYVIKNLTIISPTKFGTGIMLYNEVNDITVENVHIEGFNVGFYAAGANKAASGNQANDRVILRDSVIINNHKQGWLGGCNDCLIENNIFENNGQVERFDHNIYIDSPVQSPGFENRGITIRGNTLTKSAVVNGKCAGSSLVVHGIIKDLVIDNNLIKEELGKVTSYCWGIQVDPGNALDESFIGVKIINNKLINMGNTGIACSSCVNAEIKNNSIIDEGKILRAGISVPNKKSEDTVKSKNIIIENNTIMLNHEWGYGVNLSGSNPFIVRNNIVSINELYNNSRCFMLSDANLNTDVSNNTCDKHTKVSINNANQDDPPAEVADNEEVVVQPVDDEVVAEIEPETTSRFTQQPEPEEVLNNPDVVTEKSDAEVNDSTELMPVSRTNILNQGTSITSETGTEVTSTIGTKSRIASSDSISGGSSSETSSNSSTSPSTASQDNVTDRVAYFETTQPVRNFSSSTDGVSDTSSTKSKTIEHSSPSITKMRDVVQAKQEDLSNIEPSQCRASANGKCLMK